jgi:hypothetical protein
VAEVEVLDLSRVGQGEAMVSIVIFLSNNLDCLELLIVEMIVNEHELVINKALIPFKPDDLTIYSFFESSMFKDPTQELHDNTTLFELFNILYADMCGLRSLDDFLTQMPQELLVGLLYIQNIQMLLRPNNKFELRNHCSLEQLPQFL